MEKYQEGTIADLCGHEAHRKEAVLDLELIIQGAYFVYAASE